MKKLTPSKAIRYHCLKWCMNEWNEPPKGSVLTCTYTECQLKGRESKLRCISDYCKQCAVDFKPYECKGFILNVDENEKCPLHKFRMGKNPDIRHRRTPKHLEKYHFQKGENK